MLVSGLRMSGLYVIRSVIFAALFGNSPLCLIGFAQDVDVQAGRTRVEVDRQDVDVDVDRDRNNDRAADADQTRAEADRQIAAWLLVDQKKIVELAQYGSERTQTPEVKELAKTIISDHQHFSRMLQDRNPSQAANAPNESAENKRSRHDKSTTENRDNDGHDRDNDEARPILRLADRIEDGVDRVAERIDETRDAVRREFNDGGLPTERSAWWVNVHRQVANELAQAAKQDLARETGYAFDASFVGMLTAALLQEEATLKVLSNHASGKDSDVINNALEQVRDHQQRAARVMESIKQ